MKRKHFLRTSLAATTGLAISPLSATADSPLTDPVALPPKIVRSGKGQALGVLGSRVVTKLGGQDTYGLLTLVEDHNDPGVGIPLHVHTREDEVFRVLEGEIEFVLGETTMVLGAGDVAFAPRYVPHSWRVVGDRPARSIMIANPAGIETMFAELAKLPAGPPDLRKVAEICGRYGISFL